MMVGMQIDPPKLKDNQSIEAQVTLLFLIPVLANSRRLWVFFLHVVRLF